MALSFRPPWAEISRTAVSLRMAESTRPMSRLELPRPLSISTPGVTALKAAHRDRQDGSVKGRTGQGQGCAGHVAACAADGEDPLHFGVQIQHPAARQGAGVDARSAQQAGLLVHGENGLHPGVVRAGSSRIARAMATAMPSSPPRVVSLA